MNKKTSCIGAKKACLLLPGMRRLRYAWVFFGLFPSQFAEKWLNPPRRMASPSATVV
jgi:hypothetical protein